MKELKRYFSYIGKYKVAYWTVFVFTLVSSAVLTFAYPYMNKLIFNALEYRDIQIFWRALTLCIVLVILNCLAPYRRYFQIKIVRKIVFDIKIRLFEKLLKLDMEYYEKNHSGDALKTLNWDANSLKDSYFSHVFWVLGRLVNGITSIMAMFIYSPLLMLVSVGFCFITVFFSVRINKQIKEMDKGIQKKISHLTTRLSDILFGFTELKMYKGATIVCDYFYEENGNLLKDERIRASRAGRLEMITFFLGILASFGTIGVGAYLVSCGRMDYGTVMAIVSLSYKNKLKQFMMENEIWQISELNYYWREKYCEYLKHRMSKTSCELYIKTFDRVKLHSLRKQPQIILAGKRQRPEYADEILYLPYHPNIEIAERFCKENNKNLLAWDFTLKTAEKLKRQIFQVLHYFIENAANSERMHAQLGGLARLYDFCVLEQIEDLEKLEIDQIERFQKTFTTEYQRHYYAGVTYWCGRALFMEAEEIHWDANVWYMDRMHLQPERIDPAAPVMSLSFAEVTNKENRKLLQKYLRYGIGITNISISSLRTEFLVVRKFLGDMNQPEKENICMVTEQQMDAWLRSEQQREVQADTFNKKVMCILHFFQYLQIKDYITAIPFDPNYYLKKTFMQHHDRSVAQETMDQIRRNLYRFPEEVRLMYLHLWGVGLRISEVCTLKGNAYYLQGKDAWIQVYQIKMRTYKRIPIPMTLYRLMQVYITKYKRKAEEYIFQNRNGGAYRKTTFQQTMKRLCEECNIQNGEYLFKSHDYRHTLATTFYDAGVPIQSIRDYLGHEYEEMTLQYLDYMPKRIENANEEYFKRKSLASCLRKGVENGEQNLYQGNDTVQSDCVDETAGEVYNWGPVL